jgi:predicted transcriptional regulator
MESSEKEPLDYFQIAGFCLIAAIFSRRFIEGMWEKLLQQLKKTEDKVEKTEDKVEKTSQVVEEEKEKVATLIGLQEEPDDLESDRNLKLTLTDYEVMGLDEMQPFLKKDMMTIMDALDDPNYRFRTVRGIATATKLDRDLVSGLLEALADKAIGAVKKIRKDDKDLWVLTEKGRKGLQEFKKE